MEIEPSLPTLFQDVYKLMVSSKYEELDEEKLSKLIDDIERCDALVRQEAIFSKNESMDDIHTENLKVKLLW